MENSIEAMVAFEMSLFAMWASFLWGVLLGRLVYTVLGFCVCLVWEFVQVLNWISDIRNLFCMSIVWSDVIYFYISVSPVPKDSPCSGSVVFDVGCICLWIFMPWNTWVCKEGYSGPWFFKTSSALLTFSFLVGFPLRAFSIFFLTFGAIVTL